MERNKEAQNAVLIDLQNEMKSLKSLLVNRRPTVPEQGSSAPSTPTDGLSSRLAATLNASGSRAGIPAWQMAATQSSSDTPTEASSSTEDEVKK